MKRWFVALVAVASLLGCSSLPESGPVVRQSGSVDEVPADTALFSPPGPTKGDSPEEVVNGFLTAMQANPSSTTTAREFLARSARAIWSPERATMLYQAKGVDSVPAGVQVRLSDAALLDSRGSWAGPVTGGANRITFMLRKERGEWRITNPPDALMLPMSDFTARYTPYNLYFFDQTGQILVPNRVYLPRGRDTASSLVRSLLAGPSGGIAKVATSEFPAGTQLGLSVLVGDDGSADVPLGPEMRNLSPERLTRAVAQLSWTLRQIPGLTSMRLSVEDQPLPLPGGGNSVTLTQPGRFTPVVPSSTDLFALRQGRLVVVEDAAAKGVSGPFGKSGFSVGSIAVDLTGDRVVAVSSSGGLAFSAPRTGGKAADVRRVYSGTRILKPVIDRFGTTWLIDRTSRGARLVAVEGDGPHILKARQITGAAVSSLALSRDATRLVAAVNRPGRTPRLVVAAIVRDPDGAVIRVARIRSMPFAQLARVRSVAFTSGNDLAVMGTTSDEAATQVVLTTLDGSPGASGRVQPDPVNGAARILCVLPSTGPGEAPQIRLVTKSRSLLLTPSGRWVDSGLDTKLTALTYVG